MTENIQVAERFPIGSEVPLDRENAKILYVSYIKYGPGGVALFYILKDEALVEYFCSVKAINTMVAGDTKPRFGKKAPETKIRKFDKIVAVTRPAEAEGKKPYVFVASTLVEYEGCLAAMSELVTYQLCEEQRVTGEQTKFIAKLETKDLEHLRRAGEKLQRECDARNSEHSVLRRAVGYRVENGDGEWARVASPFAPKETPKRAEGTTKAGPKKGLPRQAKASKGDGQKQARPNGKKARKAAAETTAKAA